MRLSSVSRLRLQVNDQLRLRHLLLQQVVQPVVDHQLGVVERQVREDLALGEGVVGEDQLGEEVALRRPSAAGRNRERRKKSSVRNAAPRLSL